MSSMTIFFFRLQMICLVSLYSRFTRRYMANLVSCVYFYIRSDCRFLTTVLFSDLCLMISIQDSIAFFVASVVSSPCSKYPIHTFCGEVLEVLFLA